MTNREKATEFVNANAKAGIAENLREAIILEVERQLDAGEMPNILTASSKAIDGFLTGGHWGM